MRPPWPLRWQVIEVGVPFTDPMADGTTIQRANEVALANGVVGPKVCIEVVAEARKQGLKVPVVLMGYCNPFVMLVLLLPGVCVCVCVRA